MRIGIFSFFFVFILSSTSCGKQNKNNNEINQEMSTVKPSDLSKYDSATFGAGCFWCVEAIYQSIKGVVFVESGYAGGHVKDPTYKEVCSGMTGHAEVARIWFDPEVISFEDLLHVFWHVHDPTTLNRQGNDVGTQYRSAIFYHSEDQKLAAEKSKSETDESDLWEDPIVTEISPSTSYYAAENYHQNYFNNNPNQGYCSIVVAPKVRKFKKEFSHLLKSN